jgi:hypothetical protein
LYSQSQLNDATKVLEYVSYLGTLIFPAALIRLFKPSTQYFLAFYIGLHALLVAVTLFVGMTAGITNEPLTRWLCPIPNCVFLLGLSDQITVPQATEFLRFAGLVTVGSLGVLLARAMTLLRESEGRTSGNSAS